MNALVNTMNNLISVSDFNKGEAGKIFASVKESNIAKLVLRRNEPECVLMSPRNYIEMVQELENLRDYKLAMERIEKCKKTYNMESVLKQNNISQAEIEAAEEVEFE